MKIHVFLPDDYVLGYFIPPENQKKLEALGQVTYNKTGAQYTEDMVSGLLEDTDVAVLGWGSPKISAANLPESSPLKLIVHMGGSVAPYVAPEIFARGIRVVTANELFAEGVAEGALSYMLAGLRRIPYWNSEVQNGRWRTDDYFTQTLYEATVGISGYGAISKYVVKLLQPFRAKIKIFSNHLTDEDCAKLGVQKAGLMELAETCRVISIHNSLTPSTVGLINREFLQKIQPNAVFVNTSRGQIIDEGALADELATGRFTAVLDVFEKEPLDINSRLRGLDNVMLIPHLAGPASASFSYCGAKLIDEITEFYAGRPLKYEIAAAAAARMTQ